MLKFQKLLSFLNKSETEVLAMVDTSMDIALECVDHLNMMLRSLEKRDWTALQKQYEKLDEVETRGDSLRMHAVEKICSGAFFGGMREDLLDLLEKIDSIADSAKDSGKILTHRRIDEDVLSAFFNSEVFRFLEACRRSVESLKVTIDSLRRKRRHVIEAVRLVETYEEEADRIKAGILDALLNCGSRDTLDIVQLRDFINLADNMADFAEDSSDVAIIMIAKGAA